MIQSHLYCNQERSRTDDQNKHHFLVFSKAPHILQNCVEIFRHFQLTNTQNWANCMKQKSFFGNIGNII